MSAAVRDFPDPEVGAADGVLTFPFATALHLNLRLASARSRASCSSLAKVQCRLWLLLWYMLTTAPGPGRPQKRPPDGPTARCAGLSRGRPGCPACGAGTLTSRSRGTPSALALPEPVEPRAPSAAARPAGGRSTLISPSFRLASAPDPPLSCGI